jgi:hypothetical protein
MRQLYFSSALNVDIESLFSGPPTSPIPKVASVVSIASTVVRSSLALAYNNCLTTMTGVSTPDIAKIGETATNAVMRDIVSYLAIKALA